MERMKVMRRACVLLALAGAAFTGSAAAAPVSPGATQGAVDEYRIVMTDGDDRYEVVVTGDKVDARVNGLRLPQDRIVRSGRTVRLLDDEGKIMESIELAPNGEAGPSGSTRMLLKAEVELEHPPVMLGVLLEPVDGALRSHLGLSEHAVVLEKVMDGLPAQKAGLERWDIVVGVGGEPLTGERSLHDILMQSEPGDELLLDVIRKGKEMELSLELEAYNAAALQTETLTLAPTAPMAPGLSLNWSGAADGMSQAKRALEEVMRSLRSVDGERGLEEARREIERTLEEMDSQRFVPGMLRSWRFDNRGRLFPSPGAERNGDAKDRLGLEQRLGELEKDIETRLEDLESRWSEVEGALDRLFERLEQNIERRLDRAEKEQNKD